MRASLLQVVVICTLACALGLTQAKDHGRVHESVPLSKKHHYADEEEHGHDPEYDHEAFLGEEEAHEYDDLSPEESKERLMFIFDKIDVNSDKFISPDEMKRWIRDVQRRGNQRDTDTLWKDVSPNDQPIQFDDYYSRTYSSEIKSNDKELPKHKQNDQRKWNAADVNKDGKLTKEEYLHFEHPEEAEHMKDVVIAETMEEVDKNKDGFITLEEFLADTNDTDVDKDATEREIKKFKEVLDINKDGKLDRDEVRRWEFPDGYKHDIEDEVAHLMKEADLDKDNKLSKDEMHEKYDVFVSSRATDYGETLHEEL